MGDSEFLILIFVPITIMIALTLMFGTAQTSAVLADVGLIQNITSNISSRDNCESVYSQCSNDNCSLINIVDATFPCGDTFYVLLIIGSAIALPALIIGLPILIMVPLLTISVLGFTYVLADFWYIYAPMWTMFGIGVWKIIW